MEHKPLFSLKRQRVTAGDYVFFSPDFAGDLSIFAKAMRRTREQGLENWWNWWANLDREDYCLGMAPTLAEASEAIFHALACRIERDAQEDLKRPRNNRPSKQPYIDHSKEQIRAAGIKPMQFFNKIDKDPPQGV